MQLNARLLLATGGVALMLGGTGVALAATGKSADRSKRPARAAVRADRQAFLDDVAKRAGVDPAKLRDALKSLRTSTGPGLRGPALFGGIAAAAKYLGLQPRDLMTQLRTKTLAQIASEKGKSLDGLEQALRDAAKTALDRARTNGRITQKQQDEALAQLDSSLGDLVNGRNPQTTALAKALGIDRDKLANAIRDAKLADIDKALADKKITQAQADRLKQRIQAGEKGLFGFGLGFLGRPGGPGPRGGPGGPGPRMHGNCDGRGKKDGQARPRNGAGPGFAAPEPRPAAVFS